MKYFLSVFISLVSSLSVFAQNDSISHLFQQELKELRTQRIQDSLKLDVLTQELQLLIYKETEYNNEKLAKINYPGAEPRSISHQKV